MRVSDCSTHAGHPGEYGELGSVRGIGAVIARIGDAEELGQWLALSGAAPGLNKGLEVAPAHADPLRKRSQFFSRGNRHRDLQNQTREVKNDRIEGVLSAFLGRSEAEEPTIEAKGHGVSGVALGVGLVRVRPDEA